MWTMAISSIVVMVIGSAVISSPEDFVTAPPSSSESKEPKMIALPPMGETQGAPVVPVPAETSVPPAHEKKASFTIMQGIKDTRFLLLLMLMLITNCKESTRARSRRHVFHEHV